MAAQFAPALAKPILVIHGLELLVDYITTDSIDCNVKPVPLLPLDYEIGQ
jgi:hypothetical protein